ncbi:MAG: PAS domain-containing protein [Sedimentisphaerales bacterium]|nr:PAS domain-containing protein [Sedimentisphaerales bacterium]
MATKKNGKDKTKKTTMKTEARETVEADTAEAKEAKEGLPIVGIGASAGGLEAFEGFFKNMPADNGMAFVLVPHLDPTHISLLPELLQKHTKMKVSSIKDGTQVAPNQVYIIPPNKRLEILRGKLHLMELEGVDGTRLPVDSFFRSLALDQKGQAIGIVLSGTGSDGSLGIKEIRGEGGMVMVQSPETAKYDGMPQSAINTGMVDFILAVEEIPEQLLKYMQHVIHRKGEETVPVRAESHGLQKIFILLRNETGHDFSLYKKNTFYRRIERRMHVHQIDTISNYVRFLERNPHEIRTLFKELLIGVTSFFRDADSYEIMKEKVFPELFENKPDNYMVRIWIPGCASGEEAYSLAIILREYMDKYKVYFNIQIFGTDIDEDAIRVAREGIYQGSISADVSSSRLQSFFDRENGSYRIKKSIREMLIFAPQNIISDPPFTKLDLLCCRNLLIYLDGELQKKILPVFHYSLKPGGILMLGSSESIGEFTDLFSTVDKKWRVFRRKDSATTLHVLAQFPIIRRDYQLGGGAAQGRPGKAKELTVAQLVEKVMLEDYVPPSVIIDEKGRIVYIHGRTGKYLEPASGEAHWNIMDMARPGLKVELATAIHKALTQKHEVIYEHLRVKTNGEHQCINLTVRPFMEPEALQGLLVVLFEDVLEDKSAKAGKVKKSERIKAEHQRIADLEQEIKYTKESLQTTIEELETSNEELKSTNEELQSTNEELQSTNEELETSKEELQSLNEELVTVNAELQSRVDELAHTNDDMRNFLDSTDIATIFVDNQMQLKRFTPKACELINLINTDLDRPIGHIVSNLEYDGMVDDARKVAKTLETIEKEVRSKDNCWFFMRIFPYRTVANVIDGVVITFQNISDRKKAEEAAIDAHIYAENIVNTVREPLLVLDGRLKVISASRSFYGFFQSDPKEILGRYLYELGNREWNIPRLRELLESVLPQQNKFEDFRVEHDFERIGKRVMLLNGRQIVGGNDGKAKYILLAIEDVTGKV